jgi:hypothetical protein
MRPLQHQTWETFSVNRETDVRITFQWLREALLKPLLPGSRVVVISSGAALNANGSPLSGEYAGPKATQRFITGYAQDEAARAGLGISFASVLPQFAPLTAAAAAGARTPRPEWQSVTASKACAIRAARRVQSARAPTAGNPKACSYQPRGLRAVADLQPRRLLQASASAGVTPIWRA